MGVMQGGRRGFLAVLALAWLGLAGPIAAATPLRVERLEILAASGPVVFQVEIADTDASREQGLMFRKNLGPNKGMLFDFKRPQQAAFWMKNTLIPLDILYIAADGRIVSIARNAVPHSEVPIPSGGVVLGVLEIAGGRAAQLGIYPGDRVKHRIFKGG
jgi:uncharacterized membrane protein (UPF0127 family)